MVSRTVTSWCYVECIPNVEWILTAFIMKVCCGWGGQMFIMTLVCEHFSRGRLVQYNNARLTGININQKTTNRMLQTNIIGLVIDFIIESSFQEGNRLPALTFNANDSTIGYSRYFLLIGKVEHYNFMIDGIHFLY